MAVSQQDYIGDRAVDQPLQDLLFERCGVRAVGVVPGTALVVGPPSQCGQR